MNQGRQSPLTLAGVQGHLEVMPGARTALVTTCSKALASLPPSPDLTSPCAGARSLPVVPVPALSR